MTKLSLTKVGIDGFRGLRSLELIGLGRVNILVGSNNSGKTSVLEAISILCQPYNTDEWLSMVHRRDFGGFDETRSLSLRWCFTQTSALTDYDQYIEAFCKFTCLGSFPLRELKIKYSEFTEEVSINRPNLETYNLNSENMGPFMDDFAQQSVPNLDLQILRGAELQHFLSWDQSLDSNFTESIKKDRLILRVRDGSLIQPRFGKKNIPKLDTETLNPYSFQVNRNQVKALSNRIFQYDNPSVLELLKDFDADIEDIQMASFRGDRPAIYIKHKKLGVAPLSIFGDAMRRSVLLAATLLSIKGGGVLLIDEVEVGIHVGALARVFEWLVKAARQLEVQIFVTTHSLEAVDALISSRSKSEGDDIVAFHVSQTEEYTGCKRFSGDLLHRLRFDRGLDVR